MSVTGLSNTGSCQKPLEKEGFFKGFLQTQAVRSFAFVVSFPSTQGNTWHVELMQVGKP